MEIVDKIMSVTVYVPKFAYTRIKALGTLIEELF